MSPQPSQSPTSTTTRVHELLRPDVTPRVTSDGIVDALPGPAPPAPGRAQAAWQTDLGSCVYQRIQPGMARLLAPAYRTVPTLLRLQPGQVVADVGCGPGNLTTTLADTVGRQGLAVGVDVSTPMLARAAAQARENMGLVRGDAQRLPLRDASVDAACATAVVMLVDDPQQALSEMIRVVAPGGWLLVIAPCRPTGITAPFTRPITDLLGRIGGARMFETGELASLLDQLGCDRIHSHLQANMITVTARKPR